MDWVRQHRSDLASILAAKLQSGVIDRRGFLQGLAALGLVVAVRPYVVITVTAVISNFDPRLEQAARNLRASTGQTLRMVVIPNLATGIISGAIFAFVHSWDELIIVLFVASRRVVTLPRMIWSGINESLDPVIAVIAAILICFTLMLLVPIVRLRGRA